MASSTRLRLLEPRRAWLVFSLVALVLFAAAVFGLYHVRRLDNQRLVETELQSLMRAQISLLDQGRYRAFIEALGSSFTQSYVRIEANGERYVLGIERPGMHCAQVTSNAATVSLCRPFEFFFFPYVVLIFFYVVVSFVGYLLVVMWERRSIAHLRTLITSAGVELGEATGLLGILRRLAKVSRELDLARRREVELAKREALGQMAAHVAHDLKSPLFSLRVLSERRRSIPETELDEMLSTLTSRITDLVQGLVKKKLAIEQEPGVSEREGGQLGTLRAGEVVRLLSRVVKNKQSEVSHLKRVQVALEPSGSSGSFSVISDAEQLERVVSNLISNSVEAMEGKGTCRVALVENDLSVEINIRDTGPGIPTDLLARLFEPGATHGKSQGTGMGLWHAKQCMGAWGGQITVTNPESGGCLARLSFPKAAPK